MNVVEAIRQKYPGMTKKQKALAEYMLAQPDSMSFMTLKALAAAAQVSEMTILHYCTALGFANYNELKSPSMATANITPPISPPIC